MKLSHCVIISLAALVHISSAAAQRPSTDLPPGTAEARALLNGGKPAEALAAYEGLVKQHPKVGQLWLDLGRAAAAADNYPRAVQAFERGVAVDSNPRSIYNAGAAHARLGHTDKALMYLKLAAATGQVPIVAWRTDGDLASVRKDPRFEDLLKLALEKTK